MRRQLSRTPAREIAAPVVVLRSWLVVPPRKRAERAPVLTGLFGFPWPEAEIDARCAAPQIDAQGTARPTDAASTHWPAVASAERHHRVVPAESCTCGIYANAEPLAEPPNYLIPRAVPVVSGFVELSGRILELDGLMRAQHGRIIGPLTLDPPRLPRRLAMRRARPPERVIDVGGRFRVGWSRYGPGIPYGEWRTTVGGQLEQRYGVPVIVARGHD